MIDLNDELEKILKKYGLYKKDLLKNRIEKAIRQVVGEYTNKFTDRRARIIIRGLKNSKQYPLVRMIAEYGDIIAIVDKKPIVDRVELDQTTVIDVLDLSHAEDLECDVYIINAKNAGKNISLDVKNQGKKYYVMDLYTEIRTRFGILLTKPYEEYEDETDFSHNKTHEAYELYKNEQNEEHFAELLSASLMNRDFVTFYEVIGEAEDLVRENENFLKLKNDIDHLINEVKRLVKDRKTNKMQDVILHWIDQVAYEELDNFPKLKEIMKKGLFFENAYTVTPYTTATEAHIFYSEVMRVLNVWDVVYKIRKDGISDSKLVKNMHNRGYEFIMTGGMVEECLPEYKNEYTQYIAASSVFYWDMLNKMLHTAKPVFGIVTCTIETHEPWMSPKCCEENPSFEFSGSYSAVENKIKESACYYDRVIDFFDDIFTDNTINIYMSDHGKWEDIDLRRYDDFAMHSILSITNIGIAGRVSRIFSYKYFSKLILQVLDCAERNTHEHIFGDVEIKTPKFIATVKERVKESYDREEEIENVFSDICSGYIGIKTDVDTYIHVDNGKEIYLLAQDHEKINRVDEADCHERIDSLRRRIKDAGE